MLSGSVPRNGGRPAAACRLLMIPTAVGPPWISAMMSCASVLVARRIGAPMFAYLSCTHCPWRVWDNLGGGSNRTAKPRAGAPVGLPGTAEGADTYIEI